ncbi:transposable element Tcb1 transposase [Trichonephila clavipes]|nr:transposable element Tcb1 transposase [Trichonephila clavipes]
MEKVTTAVEGLRDVLGSDALGQHAKAMRDLKKKIQPTAMFKRPRGTLRDFSDQPKEKETTDPSEEKDDAALSVNMAALLVISIVTCDAIVSLPSSLKNSGRIIGKLEEGRSVTSVAAEFGIAHSIVSRLWNNFKLQEQLSGGSVVVVHEEPHPQMTGTLSYRPEETGGDWRGESLTHDLQATGTTDIAFYRSQKTARWWSVARRPVRCVPLTPAHRRKRSLWCWEHRNWRDNEWGRVLFTDESRFSLSRDSHRILIWREREAAIIPRTSLKGTGMEVAVFSFGEASCGSRTDLHIFDAGSVNGTRYL